MKAVVTTGRAGRHCASCTHPRRTELELDLLAGDKPISILSSEYGPSIAALRRHRDHHLVATSEQVRDLGLSGTDLVVRLSEIADQLHDAAQAAEQSGRVSDLVRAADGERRALQVLLEQGIKSQDVLEEAASYRKLAVAVWRLAGSNPEIAAQLAHALEQADERAAARDVRETFLETKEVER